MKPFKACLLAMYRGALRIETWPAMDEIWIIRFGFWGDAFCLDGEEGREDSQRDMAIWVVRIGWTRSISIVA